MIQCATNEVSWWEAVKKYFYFKLNANKYHSELTVLTKYFAGKELCLDEKMQRNLTLENLF